MNPVREPVSQNAITPMNTSGATMTDGRGEKPQHVYSVRFTARELWGADASPCDNVHIDLWDDHLDPA